MAGEPRKTSGALLIFYILVIYVAFQFLWWSYLIIDLSHEILTCKMELISAYSTPAQSRIKLALLHREMAGKWFMVIGEGSVFLVILALGVVMVRRSFRKEKELVEKQNTFLHSITHEFKSPVASLQLQLETLQKRNLNPGQQQKALANAIDDTERLDKLIEKTLIAARIDNSEIPIHLEFMNLSDKLKEVIEQTTRSFPERKVIYTKQEGVYLHIDPWALNSVISNLLENAFLYSPADKEVEVDLKTSLGLKEEFNKVILSVKDQGIGIPDKEKKQVFHRFYRSESTQGVAKGTGLGLFLVNYFVKAHGGKVVVKDNIPEGSIFELTFPSTKANVHRK
jgi:signal transduction histidine kinase